MFVDFPNKNLKKFKKSNYLVIDVIPMSLLPLTAHLSNEKTIEWTNGQTFGRLAA